MDSLLDRVLKDKGLKYDDLNAEERETYRQKTFEIKTLTIPAIIEHIQIMKNSIALQLTDTSDNTENVDKNRKLKARLKNYILLESFLVAPQKAEEALIKALNKNEKM